MDTETPVDLMTRFSHVVHCYYDGKVDLLHHNELSELRELFNHMDYQVKLYEFVQKINITTDPTHFKLLVILSSNADRFINVKSFFLRVFLRLVDKTSTISTYSLCPLAIGILFSYFSYYFHVSHEAAIVTSDEDKVQKEKEKEKVDKQDLLEILKRIASGDVEIKNSLEYFSELELVVVCLKMITKELAHSHPLAMSLFTVIVNQLIVFGTVLDTLGYRPLTLEANITKILELKNNTLSWTMDNVCRKEGAFLINATMSQTFILPLIFLSFRRYEEDLANSAILTLRALHHRAVIEGYYDIILATLDYE